MGRVEIDSAALASILSPAATERAAVERPASPDAAPRFELDLRGLSIAEPLVTARRWLVASAARWSQGANDALVRVGLTDAPAAAAASRGQRAALQGPADDAPAAGLGLAALSRRMILPEPWEPQTPPTSPQPPTPAAAAMIPGEAKFDAAGVAVTVLGGMLILFGGEAVVLWMVKRRRTDGRKSRPLASPLEDESVFRFPDTVEVQPQDPSYSRAA